MNKKTKRFDIKFEVSEENFNKMEDKRKLVGLCKAAYCRMLLLKELSA